MKKLFYVVACFSAIGFCACGNKAAQCSDVKDTTAVDTIEVVDTVAVDTLCME